MPLKALGYLFPNTRQYLICVIIISNEAKLNVCLTAGIILCRLLSLKNLRHRGIGISWSIIYISVPRLSGPNDLLIGFQFVISFKITSHLHIMFVNFIKDWYETRSQSLNYFWWIRKWNSIRLHWDYNIFFMDTLAFLKSFKKYCTNSANHWFTLQITPLSSST